MKQCEDILQPDKTVEMMTMGSICLCLKYDMSGNNIVNHKKIVMRR